jgi:hypothetical protein
MNTFTLVTFNVEVFKNLYDYNYDNIIINKTLNVNENKNSLYFSYS